jgi:hypothetical protein
MSMFGIIGMTITTESDLDTPHHPHGAQSTVGSNNCAERAVRPVKIQQRTSGGCWRTLQGLTDFAVAHSYLDTATKWGIDKLSVLQQLFTTGAWLPPALTPAE